MSTPTKQEIILAKMQKAADTLLSAENLLEDGFLLGAVNRIYYACFYTASALLFQQDIYSKTHSGVQQMFSLHFIKTGILDKAFGEFFSIIFINRQHTDYDDFIDIEEDEIKNYVTSAKKFIQSALSILNQK